MVSSITLKRLEKAHCTVIRELKEVGLYTSQVEKTSCILTYAPAIFTQGYFIQESSSLMEWWGWEEGHIYLPFKIPSAHLVQVLRHEYGHALLWHHKEIARNKSFNSVFCESRHNNLKGNSWLFWSDENGYWYRSFITDYAQTDWEEDFCETFAFWLRCKGNYKPKKYGPIIDQKMEIMPKLREMISSIEHQVGVSY